MTPEQIKAIRGKRSQAEFAKYLGVRQATVSEWETGKTKPSPMAIRLLQTIRKRKG